MIIGSNFTRFLAIAAISGLAACGDGSGGGDRSNAQHASDSDPDDIKAGVDGDKGGITALFKGNADPNTTIKVNKYIWTASLEVLNFLPVEAADPFTGIISTGYGTPPGGGRAYKATINVQDPALDARSLNISLRTRSGVASADTVRAVENAILTRARQLRMRDGNL